MRRRYELIGQTSHSGGVWRGGSHPYAPAPGRHARGRSRRWVRRRGGGVGLTAGGQGWSWVVVPGARSGRVGRELTAGGRTPAHRSRRARLLGLTARSRARRTTADTCAARPGPQTVEAGTPQPAYTPAPAPPQEVAPCVPHRRTRLRRPDCRQSRPAHHSGHIRLRDPAADGRGGHTAAGVHACAASRPARHGRRTRPRRPGCRRSSRAHQPTYTRRLRRVAPGPPRPRYTPTSARLRWSSLCAAAGAPSYMRDTFRS
jgi:hypothetical protein